MPVKITGDINAEFDRQEKRLHERILDSFKRAGEDFVKSARGQVQDHAQGTYLDQTTNLRNSIGYLILFNGEKIFSDIGSAVENMDEILERVSPDGYQLIGFAGMNYASYVEAKGYNVISYQADVCFVDLTMYLEKLDLVEKGSAASLEETFIPGLGEEDYSIGLDD